MRAEVRPKVHVDLVLRCGALVLSQVGEPDTVPGPCRSCCPGTDVEGLGNLVVLLKVRVQHKVGRLAGRAFRCWPVLALGTWFAGSLLRTGVITLPVSFLATRRAGSDRLEELHGLSLRPLGPLVEGELAGGLERKSLGRSGRGSLL